MKMKFNSSLIITVFLMLIFGSTANGDKEGAAGFSQLSFLQSSKIQQAIRLLDYIAGDYSGAVANGVVVSAPEYDEQRSFANEIQKVVSDSELGNLPNQADIQAVIKNLIWAIEQKKDALDVKKLCEKAIGFMIGYVALELFPPSQMAYEPVVSLYSKYCASCHGDRGDASTAAAKRFTPPPLSFYSPAMASKNIRSVYQVMSYGVPGTMMPQFGHVLSRKDLWALAFYVYGLRYKGVTADKNLEKRIKQIDPQGILVSVQNSYSKTDNELRETIKKSFSSPEEINQVLAYIRVQVPYGFVQGGRFALLYAKLDEVASDVKQGSYEQAKLKMIQAYLDGFEPHEPLIKKTLVEKVERANSQIRDALSQNAPSQQKILEQIMELKSILDQIEIGDTFWSTFSASLLIALREGLEIILLIFTLLVLLKKNNQSKYVVWVHLGWIAALPIGGLTFVLFGRLLSGMQKELSEAIASFLAVFVLVTVKHTMFGNLESKKWLGFLKNRVEQATVPSDGKKLSWSAVFGLWFVSFLAIYREAFEIVVFYQALLKHGGENASSAVVLSMGLSLVVLLLTAWLLFLLGKKLDTKPVFKILSGLLMLLAVSMVGQGIHALQEGGYIAETVAKINEWKLPELRFLGIYPNWQGLGCQLAILALIVLPGLIYRLVKKQK